MSDLITSIEDAIGNVDTLYNYGQSEDLNERAFHDKRIKSGKVFVAVQSQNGYRFAPSKFAGYVDNNIRHKDVLSQRDGRITNNRLSELIDEVLNPGDDGYQEIDDCSLDYCSQYSIEPSKHHRARRYWLLKAEPIFSTPDEIVEDGLWEGAKITIKVNRFERSKAARANCLKHYGYGCSVCKVNLEDVYGDMAKNFIHVHHIVPLSSIGEGYQVDAIQDLRPVCPNCHAMLHRRKEALSIDALKALLNLKA